MSASRLLVARLALRNVRRHARRSILSGSVIFFGVFFLIIARAFIDGIEYGSERAQIDANCAHLRILAAGADDEGFDLPLEPRLTTARALIDAAGRASGLVAATPRIRFSADLSDGRDQMRVVAIGADPRTDGKVFFLGADPSLCVGDPPGILVGSGMLTLLEKTVGDPVTIVARTPQGAISALDFVVRGAIATGNPAVDNLHVLLPIASARTLLALGDDDATEIAIRLESQRETDRAATAIRPALPGSARLETWVEATEDLRSLMRVRRKGMSVIVSVIMAIAAVGIANTILMSVYERFREIGTISAFGFPPASIRRMFLLEGIHLGAAGSLAGMIAGGLVTYYFEVNGIDLSPLTRSPDVVYPVAEMIYLEFSLVGLLLSGGFGVLIAAVATILPARRAALLDPVEALRA